MNNETLNTFALNFVENNAELKTAIILEHIKNNPSLRVMIEQEYKKTNQPTTARQQIPPMKIAFKPLSPNTTPQILDEFGNMDFDKLVDQFVSNCKTYCNSVGFVSSWLYIPEMMHVIKERYYTAEKQTGNFEFDNNLIETLTGLQNQVTLKAKANKKPTSTVYFRKAKKDQDEFID